MHLRIRKAWLLVILILGATFGALFYTGILDWNRTRTEAEVRADRALSRIKNELTPDVPSKGATMGEARAAALCRSNLQKIESAKRSSARRRGQSVGTITWNDIAPELENQKPVCPKGGTYTLGTLEQLPKCSLGGQGTMTRDDDHIIDQF